MVRILYSLALFYPRGRSAPLSPNRAPYLQLYRILSYSHRSIKSRRPALGTYICSHLQEISLSLSAFTCTKPEAYSHPHRRWAALCVILLVDVKMPWQGDGAAIDTVSLTSLAWCAGRGGIFVVRVGGMNGPSFIGIKGATFFHERIRSYSRMYATLLSFTPSRRAVGVLLPAVLGVAVPLLC